MPRKQQGWITFQSSDEERQLLEQVCQQSQRTKTEILRELVRSLKPAASDAEQSNSGSDASTTELPVPELELKGIQLSARNLILGTVTRLMMDAVSAEVTLEIAPGVELVSVITKASAQRLGLSEGKQVFAVIKSSNIMIASVMQESEKNTSLLTLPE